jgi:hypothetical protein
MVGVEDAKSEFSVIQFLLLARNKIPTYIGLCQWPLYRQSNLSTYVLLLLEPQLNAEFIDFLDSSKKFTTEIGLWRLVVTSTIYTRHTTFLTGPYKPLPIVTLKSFCCNIFDLKPYI